jgi:sensor domain CHASE-containing protein
MLIVGGILLTLVIALILTAQLILTSGFEQLEAEAVRDNVERVGNALDDEINRLLSTNADWAYWDDTYQFIADGNQDYIDANLTEETLNNLNLSFMVFVNPANEIVFSRYLDRTTAEERALPDLSALLQPGAFFVTHQTGTETRGGIVMLSDGLFMMVSRAILTNDLQGPARGTLIFGRSMDAEWQENLAASLKLNPGFLPVGERLDDTGQNALAELTEQGGVYLHPLNDREIQGYGLVYDPQNAPILLYQVTIPRDILAQGRTTFTFFALSLVGLALVGGALTVFMLDRTVLSRLGKLREDVERISLAGDLSKRVQPSGNDELGVLGRKLNEMLNALEYAQQMQKEHAERLSTLVQNAPVILWAVDNNGTLTALDGSELHTLTPQPQSLIGKPLAQWTEYLPVREDEFREVLRGTTITTTANRNGQTFATHFAPLKDRSGTIRGVIGVATNISGQITAEEGLQRANENLEHKNRQLRRAHEILRSTVEQLRELIQRGASTHELSEEIKLAEREFEALS